jgi:hypothetical protein
MVLSPNAQIWPRALNTAIGGDADAIYLVVADMSYPLRTGGGGDADEGRTGGQAVGE